MFKTNKPQQDRAYNEMLTPILNALSEREIRDLAEKSGGTVAEDGEHLLIDTLGERLSVRISNGEILPGAENWHVLVLLHYIANADGTLPAGRWISFGDMKNGLIRGTKYAGTSEKWFIWFLKGKNLEEIEKACICLGGIKAEGRGDINVILPFLPYFPVLVSLWEADDEFDATGKILIDQNADHYLSIEDAVTVGEIVQKRIESSWMKQQGHTGHGEE